MTGVKSESGAPLLHDFGYYTVNQIPGGVKLAVRAAPKQPASAGASIVGTSAAASAPPRVPESSPATPPAASSAPAARAPGAGASAAAPSASAPARVTLAKHQTTMPAAWNGKVDQTVSVAGEDGLKFSVANFDVKAGARVKLDFSNPSDMLHNLVITRPGTGTKVGEEALKLGLDGAKMHYVPRSEDVLYHTSLLEPNKSEAIYFQAPTTPGEYPFVCTFPGHYITMQGTMRVGR
jgi:uncharacterized cupredoxin-like copper-binding protein